MTESSERVAVVTGASRGIGRAAALGLARQGVHVIAVARTIGGLEELDDEIRREGGAATLVPIDLKDFAAIDRLGAEIYKRWGKLDIFLGAAGILGMLTPIAHLEPRIFDDTMAVNFTANWRLLRSFDMLLRRSEGARILFLTSSVAQSHPPFWGPVAMSKAALEAMAKTYAAETRQTRMAVNLLDPGPIRTRFRALAMPGEDPEHLDPPLAVVPEILRLLSPEFAETGRVFSFRNARATAA
jgi:NAD(P)-dependent dehydrogenase (short-subunit alcohol dehydrogenase family)